MAGENKPYVGYRSAGRRSERFNDRTASADAPLAALRGVVSGVLGAPGDIESLIRMLPYLNEQTALPTSEDVERRLPMPQLSATPVGRAATNAGQLIGGFYNGPGSPLRALASLPAAVKHGAGEFARAAGVPAANVIKNKGGNWLAGSVEDALKPMKSDPRFVEQFRAANVPVDEARVAGDEAVNRWLDQKLAKYIRNEMATPEDPLRLLADRGVTHYEQAPLGTYNLDALERGREAAGFPAEGLARSRAGREWEAATDRAVYQSPAEYLKLTKEFEKNPWLSKVSGDTTVYEIGPRKSEFENLGFNHLIDELRNAINPESGLPRELLWKYSDLSKVTVPQAVERVAKINDWRAAQKAVADQARANNAAAHVFKEYPEQGYKWVELKAPEALPEGWVEVPESGGTRFTSPSGKMFSKEQMQRIPLEDALKYEGEVMGHCVGGYCDDVASGSSRIFSLRDAKGEPHVTIEVRPPNKEYKDTDEVVQKFWEAHGRDPADKQELMSFEGLAPEIIQIKGKQNRAPKDEYLPMVQDFVRSQKWSRVGDVQNTGLYRKSDFIDEFTPEQLDAAGVGEYLTMGEIRSLRQGKPWRPIDTDPPLDIDVPGYAAGGLVTYDSNEIDELARQLSEEMNG